MAIPCSVVGLLAKRLTVSLQLEPSKGCVVTTAHMRMKPPFPNRGSATGISTVISHVPEQREGGGGGGGGCKRWTGLLDGGLLDSMGIFLW